MLILRKSLLSLVCCALVISSFVFTGGINRNGTMNFSVTAAASTPIPTRDPWLWPFTVDSIWNMPIGSGAVYSAANLGVPTAGYVTADQEFHFVAKVGDPVQNIFAPYDFTDRCNPASTLSFGTMVIPDTALVADASANPYSVPNDVSATLQPNGRTFVQLEPTCRDIAGGPVYGYRWQPDLDLFSQGIEGTHWGSGLSGLGGTLRQGDLIGSEPIHHALKINLYAHKYLYYSTGDSTPGYRWPANRSDNYAGDCTNNPSTCYNGTNYQLQMGSLLAIPPSVTASSLGLVTAPAIKMFNALRDYGGYVADDTAWDVYAFSVSNQALTEFQTNYGYAFGQSSSTTNAAAKDWYNDYVKLMSALNIVDNNASDAIGGGGTPRAQYAPRFATTWEAEAYTSKSGDVQTETTSDTGGGKDITNLATNDYMNYLICADETGSYTIDLRVASPVRSGKIQFYDMNGAYLGSVNVPYTGGGQNWQTISLNVNLTKAYSQNLRVYVASGGWNFNWFEVKPSGA